MICPSEAKVPYCRSHIRMRTYIPDMVRRLGVVVVLGLISGAVRAQTCGDIRSFDFRNASIPIAAKDEGGSSGPDLFRLQNGRGFSSGDPDSAQSHDWQLDLVTDRLEQPDHLTWIRVIVVNKDHLTGTGSWQYVMAFDCQHGSLVSLFQYGSEGVELKRLSEETLVLYQAIWKKGDPHCCPSGHTVLAYRWNPSRHRYERASSKSGPGFTMVPEQK
jgi:hypothetical protein